MDGSLARAAADLPGGCGDVGFCIILALSCFNVFHKLSRRSSQVSIPGTHDSATFQMWPLPVSWAAWTQFRPMCMLTGDLGVCLVQHKPLHVHHARGVPFAQHGYYMWTYHD